ncbi:hypothetical protein MA16_Dca006804 [Dendrobium catenatum]|uniref:Uncharacterized protein n=1 Tax=Dendrobium catenatum TaxID=906689 RepID=A0A2I0W995_9ASPA|nr:hypothetical protein MA16_Dca006804 [Dendrobium catenatum]
MVADSGSPAMVATAVAGGNGRLTAVIRDEQWTTVGDNGSGRQWTMASNGGVAVEKVAVSSAQANFRVQSSYIEIAAPAPLLPMDSSALSSLRCLPDVGKGFLGEERDSYDEKPFGDSRKEENLASFLRKLQIEQSFLLGVETKKRKKFKHLTSMGGRQTSNYLCILVFLSIPLQVLEIPATLQVETGTHGWSRQTTGSLLEQGNIPN